MAIPEFFSDRNRTLPDTLTYDKIPTELKNQIIHIWNEFYYQIREDTSLTQHIWEIIESQLSKAHGKKTLLENSLVHWSNNFKVENYFDNLQEVNKCLDVIECVFKSMMITTSVYNSNYRTLKFTSDEAIKELNSYFLKSGIGFQFSDKKIIRIDSKLLHQEIIQPALLLLKDKDFENANEEFRNALEHFRFQRNKECLNDSLKAFETTMKIVCHQNNWAFEEKDTASKLINILLLNGFLPNYHEMQLNGIRQMLESGSPTLRNKNSGHGQGVNKIIVNDSLASYMLYTTGAAIKFLIDVQKEQN